VATPGIAMRLAIAVTLLSVTALLGGCAADEQGAGGECNIRVGFQGIVFRAHNALNQAAPAGRSLGNGNLLGCDGSTVGHEEVFALRGVDPRVAVLVKAAGHGVYVAEGVPQTAWPAPLKQP
jgi:hypothetical protein